MNVVIVSGGLQTRFNELSCFPKVLLPSISGKSILEEQLKYFESHDVYIVVNKRFETMTKAFIKANNLLVDVIVSDNTNGSGNTLSSVYDELPKKDVLFFWSDILFTNSKFNIDPKINFEKDNCIIFTTNDNKFRYKIENGNIVNRSVSYDGNVPGIFWIKDISRVISKDPVSENKDLIDIIQEKVNEGIISFTESKIDTSIIEYKSLYEYKKLVKEVYTGEKLLSNDFQISYNDDMQMQTVGTNDNEIKALKYQFDWENTISHTFKGCSKYYVNMPLNENGETLVCDMRNLEGYNIYKEVPHDVIDKIINILSTYKCYVTPSKNIKYLLNEYVSKPLLSYASVMNLLKSSVYFNDIKNIVEKCANLIVDKCQESWVFTHGNLAGDSIFVNSLGTVKLINPRSRNDNTFYCPPIVDLSEAELAHLGIVEKLRDFLIYENDVLPKIPENVNLHIKIAMLLHLMNMLPEFSGNILKLNILFDYIMDNLVEVVSENDIIDE